MKMHFDAIWNFGFMFGSCKFRRILDVYIQFCSTSIVMQLKASDDNVKRLYGLHVSFKDDGRNGVCKTKLLQRPYV